MLTRRRLLIHGGLAGLVLAGGRLDALGLEGGPERSALQDDLWATSATILGRIKAPVFPARDVPVTRHGAKGDGTTDCTAAFRAAIEACRGAGGGRVVVLDSPRLDRALRFKNNAARGGVIERVAMRDVTVGEVAEAVVAADFFYEEGKNGAYKPVLRDVEVRNVTSRKSKHAFLLRGYDDSPITNVRVLDCTFDGVQSPDILEGVRDLVLTNVTINGKRRDERISR